MQAAGHVGRRIDDGEGLGIGPLGAEQAVLLPMRIPLRLDCGGVESLVELTVVIWPGLCQRRLCGARAVLAVQSRYALSRPPICPHSLSRCANGPIFSIEEADSGGTEAGAAAGRCWFRPIGVLDRELRSWARNRSQASIFPQCGAIDTVGAWIVWRFAREHGREDHRRERAKPTRLIEAVMRTSAMRQICAKRPAAAWNACPTAVGSRIYRRAGRDCYGVVGFLGSDHAGHRRH